MTVRFVFFVVLGFFPQTLLLVKASRKNTEYLKILVYVQTIVCVKSNSNLNLWCKMLWTIRIKYMLRVRFCVGNFSCIKIITF